MAHNIPHIISARFVARDLHAIAPRPLECTSSRRSGEIIEILNGAFQCDHDDGGDDDDDIVAEPGIRRGNEESRGNENRKWRNKIFSVGKKSTSTLFSYEN